MLFACAMSEKKYMFDAYVFDTLMRDLVGHDRRTSAFLVYVTLASSSVDNLFPRLSHAQIAEQTGLSKRGVQDALDHLIERKLLGRTTAGATDVGRYEVLTPWRRRGD
jgi:CRP-like cAMP-binding protein